MKKRTILREKEKPGQGKQLPAKVDRKIDVRSHAFFAQPPQVLICFPLGLIELGLSDLDLFCCTRRSYSLKSHICKAIFTGSGKINFLAYVNIICVSEGQSIQIPKFLAPIKKVNVMAGHSFDSEIIQEFQKRDKLYKTYKKSGLKKPKKLNSKSHRHLSNNSFK